MVVLLVNLFVSPAEAQRVGLVLSGGGAKGVAHVGVIKALEENGIPIDYVAGTSMGAIVAGLYAIGYTPDEMLGLFLSRDFELWSKGNMEEQYGYHAYHMGPRPDLFTLRFDTREGAGLKPVIRPNLVSTFPMDMAIMSLFAGATAHSGGDFNRLFVPFRSVASDISANRAHISRNGDLGSAIRASMTFPGFFRPISIDSTLLFDGGMYNNFPWDVMEEDFHPDLIIGSKCVGNSPPASEDDITSLLENLVMLPTNFDLPAEKGIVISTAFDDVGLLDYPRSREISEQGYLKTLDIIDSIRQRVSRRVSPEQLGRRRAAYRAALPELKFSNIRVSGEITPDQKDYIARMMLEDAPPQMSLEEIKKRYYKVVGTGNVRSFFPLAREDSSTGDFTLEVAASRTPRFRVSLGGNISSSFANQGYLGLAYHGWGKVLTRTYADFYLGRLYSGVRLGIRQDYPDRLNLFYEIAGAWGDYDYFRPNADLFFEQAQLTFMKIRDAHLHLHLGWPFRRNNALVLGMTAGRQESRYYQGRTYAYDIVPEQSKLDYQAFSLELRKNTLNYKQYPDQGKSRHFQLQFLRGDLKQKSGSRPAPGAQGWKRPIERVSFQYQESQFRQWSKRWALGFHIEGALTERKAFPDYYSMMATLPGFSPTAHSETLFLESLRAESWVGFGLIPVYRLGTRTTLQAGGFVMQPYRTIRQGMSGEAVYSERWHQTHFNGYGAFVWQSPLGPLSLAVHYYQREHPRWYYQFNLGFLLFPAKGIE